MNVMRFFPIFLVVTLFSCGQDETEYNEQQQDADVPTADYDELLAELNEMENVMTDDPDDMETRKKAVTRMQDFANFFPDDPKAPDYLQKASDLALILDQDAKAVKILERIQNEYPNYERMVDVDYNRASHLDWELRDTSRAKEAYQSFIDKYNEKMPDDNRIADAKIRIKYIRYGWDEYVDMVAKGQIQPVQ